MSESRFHRLTEYTVVYYVVVCRIAHACRIDCACRIARACRIACACRIARACRIACAIRIAYAYLVCL